VGILAPSTSPDDGVFFVDLKTAWAMDGHLHGHQGVAGALTNAEAGALYLYGDFSEEGVEDFHLHGDVGALPISAALIFPFDRAKHDILLGRFQDDTLRQLIRPEEVVDRVLSWLLHLRRGLMAYFSVVGMLTGLFILLVGALALRLRAEELRLMVLLGATRGRVAAMVGAEWGLLFGVGALLAGGGLWLSRRILLMFLI